MFAKCVQIINRNLTSSIQCLTLTRIIIYNMILNIVSSMVSEKNYV